MAVGAAIVAALGVSGPAWAADEPNALTIAGPGLSNPIALHARLDTDIFTRLLHQVSWMAGAGGATLVPDPATLGPKYVLTVFSGGKPLQTYNVYPEAKGGPKAFRPKEQPQGQGRGCPSCPSSSARPGSAAAAMPHSRRYAS